MWFKLIFVILQNKITPEYGKQRHSSNKGCPCRKEGNKQVTAEQLRKDQTKISKWCTNTSQSDSENMIRITKCLKLA